MERREVDSRLRDVVEEVRRLHRRDAAGITDTSRKEARDKVLRLMELAEAIGRESMPAPSVELPVDGILQNRFGRVIGRQGATIKQLQSEHPQVRIHVPKGGEGVSIMVTGPLEAAQRAVRAVQLAAM
mmetsp:Transcript_152603/g.489362  ORF Transcript_152603/g.489362 Transcript_152603/m.489362 type:complete len:128 (+) Transcript_152603:638-1021(+)